MELKINNKEISLVRLVLSVIHTAYVKVQASGKSKNQLFCNLLNLNYFAYLYQLTSNTYTRFT